MLTTQDCAYDKHTGHLFLYSEHFAGSFPREIVIESTHTGRKVTFVPISADHPRYDEDGWDGEMAIYEPRDAKAMNARLLIVSHES